MISILLSKKFESRFLFALLTLLAFQFEEIPKVGEVIVRGRSNYERKREYLYNLWIFLTFLYA